jgi:hypothetical protein
VVSPGNLLPGQLLPQAVADLLSAYAVQASDGAVDCFASLDSQDRRGKSGPSPSGHLYDVSRQFASASRRYLNWDAIPILA